MVVAAGGLLPAETGGGGGGEGGATGASRDVGDGGGGDGAGDGGSGGGDGGCGVGCGVGGGGGDGGKVAGGSGGSGSGDCGAKACDPWSRVGQPLLSIVWTASGLVRGMWQTKAGEAALCNATTEDFGENNYS